MKTDNDRVIGALLGMFDAAINRAVRDRLLESNTKAHKKVDEYIASYGDVRATKLPESCWRYFNFVCQNLSYRLATGTVYEDIKMPEKGTKARREWDAWRRKCKAAEKAAAAAETQENKTRSGR